MKKLPGGWTFQSLGEVFEVIGGGTPSRKVAANYGGDIPWATIRDMQTDEISGTERSITKHGLKNSSARLIPTGEVVMASRVGLGRASILRQDTAINQDIRALIPKHPDQINRRFCLYWLQSMEEKIVAAGSGATVQGIKLPFIRSLPFPVVARDEQDFIVAILDQAFAALDRARAHAEANLADAVKLFESVLVNAFDSHPSWPRKLLPEISENLDRQRVPITKRDRKPGFVPYYGASGVVDYVSDHIFDEDLLLVSEDGANLLARTYPIAFSISGKSWVNNHAHVLRFEDPVDQEYVRLYLNSISLAPFVTGMAQPKLNQGALNSIPIPFPDAVKRADIVAQANTIREHCDGLAANYQSHLADIASLRQSLLQQAFSGQLT